MVLISSGLNSGAPLETIPDASERKHVLLSLPNLHIGIHLDLKRDTTFPHHRFHKDSKSNGVAEAELVAKWIKALLEFFIDSYCYCWLWLSDNDAANTMHFAAYLQIVLTFISHNDSPSNLTETIKQETQNIAWKQLGKMCHNVIIADSGTTKVFQEYRTCFYWLLTRYFGK